MSSKINNFKNIKDIYTKKRVSCPNIPFYNNIIKESKEETINNKKDTDLNKINDIKEKSEEENEDSFEEKKIMNKNNIGFNNDKNEENFDYRILTGKFRNYSSFSLSSSKLSKMLKEILTRKLCLKDFSDWFNSVIISMQNDDLNEFITFLDCIQECDDLATEFFKYIYNLSKSKRKGYKYTYEAQKLYNKNKLGPICFITPEFGNFQDEDNIDKVIDDLSKGLCSLGQDIIIISPYNCEKAEGKMNYIKEIKINLDKKYSFNIYKGNNENNEKGIKYYFLENKKIFGKKNINNINYTHDTIREISCLGKASLQLLFESEIIPSIIVTNDWYTGLTPAFKNDDSFADFFIQTKFIHLIHNLEPSNEGKLYYNNNSYQDMYKFNENWLIDPNSSQRVLNPSRCAILKSDQWATVSKAYKRHLQLNSSLADILNQRPCPFAYPNGIFINEKLKEMVKLTGGNKEECKKYIQKKYFGYENPDYSVPIYSFIGKIQENKGIIMILDSFEEMFKKTNGKINLLIEGNGDEDDSYFQKCINKINIFKNKYPYSFWSNINNDISNLTKDISKIYLGSDFGIIPSNFEPGGINQHKYFICGTPVIAFKTGSLKDTVIEFNYQTNIGNGIIFDFYNNNEFLEAFMRSINLFKNKEKYGICCNNAKKNAIDISEVSKAWCKEFCKLKHKIFFDNSKIKDISMLEIEDNLLIKEYNENNQDFSNRENNIKKEANKSRKSNIFGMDSFQSKNLMNNLINNIENNNNNSNNYIKEDEVVKKFVYYYLNNYQPKVVEMSGSFDEWKKRHRLIHYPREKKWELSMKLKKGKYLYKYIIDGEWQINPREPSEKGSDGYVNNYIFL